VLNEPFRYQGFATGNYSSSLERLADENSRDVKNSG